MPRFTKHFSIANHCQQLQTFRELSRSNRESSRFVNSSAVWEVSGYDDVPLSVSPYKHRMPDRAGVRPQASSGYDREYDLVAPGKLCVQIQYIFKQSGAEDYEHKR